MAMALDPCRAAVSEKKTPSLLYHKIVANRSIWQKAFATLRYQRHFERTMPRKKTIRGFHIRPAADFTSSDPIPIPGDCRF
jgi:hypothetical protein